MSKLPKPSLSGQRIKTRKRDEKEKYEPNVFRDIVVGSLNHAQDLDMAFKYLDGAGSKLDYHRYGETLFDILITGAILAPGGSLVIDPETGVNKFSVFEYSMNVENYLALCQLFVKLIRRYKYLEKVLEDDMKKVLLFLKGFDELQREKLATFLGILIKNNVINSKIIETLFQDHLIKDGLSMDFAKILFKSWISQEKSTSSVTNALKKNNLDDKLMNLLPLNKRNMGVLEEHFVGSGLESLLTLHRNQLNDEGKKMFKAGLKRMLVNSEAGNDDGNTTYTIPMMIERLKELQTVGSIDDNSALILVWNTLMSVVEWNKKEDQIADQALRHIRTYSELLRAFGHNDTNIEVNLLNRIQEYCYDNMNFMKVFQKIVVTLYKGDVLNEASIMEWYNKKHLSKGKTIFLEQIKPFIHWLIHAEEESDEDESSEPEKEMAAVENGLNDKMQKISLENGVV